MDSESHLGTELQEDNKLPKKSCKFGKVVVGITGATALGIVLVNVPFVTQALRKNCLPYVPATERQVANVTKPAKTSKSGWSRKQLKEKEKWATTGTFKSFLCLSLTSTTQHLRYLMPSCMHCLRFSVCCFLVSMFTRQGYKDSIRRTHFPEMTCGRLNSPTWTLL
ncbi:uncharacterized protein [Montipora capricornis]|uniref:uncharacterized protein isoform X7 n=1 Tax=Montipora capricornis TaxID=246305 RepID=UPI0035F19FCC